MKRLPQLLAGAVLVLVVGASTTGVADAHHPLVSGVASCADTGWTVDWSVAPDANRPQLTWSISSPDGYAPAGSQQASASSRFTRTTLHRFDDRSATETVRALWSNGAQAERSARVGRPDGCQPPPPPPPTTEPPVTVPPTTEPPTTVPPTTVPPVTVPPVTEPPVVTTGPPPTVPPTSPPPTQPTLPPVPPVTPPATCPDGLVPSNIGFCIPPPVCSGGDVGSDGICRPVTVTTPAERVTTTTVTPSLPETGNGDLIPMLATLLVSLGGLGVVIARRPS